MSESDTVKEAVQTVAEASAKIVQKAAPTAGDSSSAAAAATDELQTGFIPFQTPADKTRESTLPLTTIFGGQRFLEPPEDPVQMYRTFQLSAFWAPIVDALLTNVYKVGFVLKPVIPFDREDEAEQMVREALMWQKSGGNLDAEVEVSDEEVTTTLKKLKSRSILEKHFIEKFFQEAVPDMSYRQLWDLTGQDLEVTGNGYWEIIRDTSGSIARFQWLPTISIRATKQDLSQIGSQKLTRDSVLGWTKEPQIRRFRRWAQVHQQHVVTWFKEFGDPRVLSRATGKFYSDVIDPITGETAVGFSALEQLIRAEQTPENPQPLPATEVFHWRLPFGGSSVYGKPRISGVHPGLIGARDNDEENLKLVNDEAIPSLLMMISGGTVGVKGYNRLKQQITERKKGRKGIMLIEAVSGMQVGVAHPQQQPKIDIERLKTEQSGDALFQKYESRVEEKAAGAYRMPQSGLGRNVGANRATFQAQQLFTEDQVYSPMREDRDRPINEQLFADLDIRMWRYETKVRLTKDPKTIAEVLRILIEAGVLTPNEAREEAGPIFNRRLDDLKGLWTQFPPRVLTVLLQTKNQQLATALLGEDDGALDKLITGVRGALGLGEDGEVVPPNGNPQLPVKGAIDDDGRTQRRPDPSSGGPGPAPRADAEGDRSPPRDA